MTLSAVQTALAPFARDLEDRLGVCLDEQGSATLACTTLPIHVANPSKHAEASAWLRRQSTAYDAALRDLARAGVAMDATEGPLPRHARLRDGQLHALAN